MTRFVSPLSSDTFDWQRSPVAPYAAAVLSVTCQWPARLSYSEFRGIFYEATDASLAGN